MAEKIANKIGSQNSNKMFPDLTNLIQTLTKDSSAYTLPQDCYVFLSGYGNSSNYTDVSANNVNIFGSYNYDSSYTGKLAWIPLPKGTELNFSQGGNGGSLSVKIYGLKG